ncbi:hypothetical protein Tco_1546495 [Tanacetum coccineum]
MEGWKHKDLKSKDFDSIKELFDKAFKMVNMFEEFRTDLMEGSSKRAGEELEQESTKKQKVDDDKETIELKQCLEIIPNEEEVTIDVIPLAVKSLRIMYMTFSHILKSFDMEDLEDLYKLVKARYGSTRLVEDLDLVLWNDLKNMFEPHVEDTMLEKKLQIDYESEIAYQLWTIVRIKSLLNAVSITATLIDVNAAQSKLVLLEEFNENYSKCLRLLVKLLLLEEVTTASGS